MEDTNPKRGGGISEMFCYAGWVSKMGKFYLVLVSRGSDLMILELDL